jgi:hypothetical protein
MEPGRDDTPKEDTSSVADLLEEVRQARASLQVYRHLVDRLLTGAICADCERRNRLKG